MFSVNFDQACDLIFYGFRVVQIRLFHRTSVYDKQDDSSKNLCRMSYQCTINETENARIATHKCIKVAT